MSRVEPLYSGFINTLEERNRVFNEQLDKTGVDFFDYYLIHDVNHHSHDIYTKLDCYNWIQEKKEQGLVKHIGLSFHDDAKFLDKILTENPQF